MSFAPLFSELLDSTVWEEEYHVRLVWITLLILKGRDQIVRGYHPYKIAKRANITLEEAIDALEKLKAPDRKYPDQPFDGRRIEEVAKDCYLILNGAEYQTKMAQTLRRSYLARKQREHRSRIKEQASKEYGAQTKKDLHTI